MKLATILVMLLLITACAVESDVQTSDAPAPTPAPTTPPEPTATAVPIAPTVVPEATATLEQTSTPEPSATSVPTASPVPTETATPIPTAQPVSRRTIDSGTHKIGTDIEPGIYAGTAGADVSEWCSWRRLSGVTGDSDEILAIEIEQGQFYVEILPTDKYFKVACEITRLADWPIPDEHPTNIERGMYLVGRDIAPGTYAGTAGADTEDWCSWRRLSGITGDSDEILAIEIEQSSFYVTIEPTDYAFEVACELILEE